VYGGERYKSLVSFTVPHRRAGALADVLDCFRGRGLNLTSISSVPSLDGPFHYLFFVEFEGSRFDDPEGRVGGVFEDLERVAERWRWLGSWRNRSGRR
jgi:prephenate dehydratase